MDRNQRWRRYGTSPDDTALYAISFTVPAFTTASLTFNYEVDNDIGYTLPGIYLNGTALPSSTNLTGGVNSASFTSLQTYTDSNITADLVTGTNWLYIDGVNLGGPGGLIFSATINTSATTVPEPAAAWLVGAAFIALLAVSRRDFRRADRTRKSSAPPGALI